MLLGIKQHYLHPPSVKVKPAPLLPPYCQLPKLHFSTALPPLPHRPICKDNVITVFKIPKIPIAGVQHDRDQPGPSKCFELLLQPVRAGEKTDDDDDDDENDELQPIRAGRLPREVHLQGEAQGGLLHRGRVCRWRFRLKHIGDFSTNQSMKIGEVRQVHYGSIRCITTTFVILPVMVLTS